MSKPTTEPPPTPASGQAATPAEFKAEVRAWADRIGVTPTGVHLRAMGKKWGSASPRGRLTFDKGLLTQPAAFRTEAIVHEVLHLRIPNHGKLFRTMLLAYLAEAGVQPGQADPDGRQL